MTRKGTSKQGRHPTVGDGGAIKVPKHLAPLVAAFQADLTKVAPDSPLVTSRCQRVMFRLDLNKDYPAGPINEPKGGFQNKAKPAPERGILKGVVV